MITTACDELEEGMPYLSVRRLFRAALGVPPQAAPPAAADRLLEVVQHHGS